MTTLRFAWSSGHSLATLAEAGARLSAVDLRVRGQAGTDDDENADVADAVVRIAGVHAR
jgi:hypothetical protein